VADVSKTSLGYITYSPGTFFHFAMIYVHEFGTGRMKQNGELPEDCYWNIAKLEQRKSLEALFNNVNGTGEEGEAIKAALLNELNVIEDTLAKKSGGDFTIEKQMLDAKKTVFLDAVEAYVSAEEVQKESKFNYAVKALEGLFRLYNTHIDRCKGISPVYKEKGLDLSGMEKAIKVKGKKITDKPVSVDNAKSGHSSMHRDEPTDHAGPVTDAVDEQLFGG